MIKQQWLSSSWLETYRKLEKQNTEIVLDPWQEKVLEYEGSISIRAGRQVGKSLVVSRKAVEFALKNPNTNTLIIAPAQRQSSLLFEKIKVALEMLDSFILEKKGRPKWDKKKSDKQNIDIQDRFAKKYGIFEDHPTKTMIILKNGARIYSLPAGKTGYFIRGFTIDLLIVDEAAYVPEIIWNSIIPMIAIARKKAEKLGWIILLSTPFGRGGYFYNSFLDEDYKHFHISSEDCPRISREFLRKERTRMTKQEYAQEYQGEFIEEFNQLFSSALIANCTKFLEWDYKRDYKPGGNYYLGVDIARFGGDENSFVVGELIGEILRIIKVATTERKSIVDTVKRIEEFDAVFKFRKIFIDDAGVGGGAFDLLVETVHKNKVVGLNNATRSVDEDKSRSRRLLKEDLYSNAIVLMESGKLEMISSLALQRSLKSMTFEYTLERNLHIHGNNSHIAEAFVRVCWCVRQKGLRLFIY